MVKLVSAKEITELFSWEALCHCYLLNDDVVADAPHTVSDKQLPSPGALLPKPSLSRRHVLRAASRLSTLQLKKILHQGDGGMSTAS